MKAEESLHENLIRRVSTGNGSRTVLKNRVLVAEEEAESIIQKAKQEAATLLEEARTDADSIRGEAYDEGLHRSLSEFESLLAEAREIRSNVLQNSERELLELSIKIAEKILRTQLESNDKAIVDIVASALDHARQRETIVVHINPAEFAVVSEARESFNSSQRTKVFDFVSDPAVPAGGCVIETEVGQIDARLETQLSVMSDALVNRSVHGDQD